MRNSTHASISMVLMESNAGGKSHADRNVRIIIHTCTVMFRLIVCDAFSGIARRCCCCCWLPLRPLTAASNPRFFCSLVCCPPPTAIQLLPARPDADASCRRKNQPGLLRPGEGEKSQVLADDDEEDEEDPRCDRRSTVPALRGWGEIRRRGAAGISGRRRIGPALVLRCVRRRLGDTCIPSSPFEKQHKASS